MDPRLDFRIKDLRVFDLVFLSFFWSEKCFKINSLSVVKIAKSLL